MLSVVEIQNKEFKKNKLGGYKVEEVNDYLGQIVKSFQELINENHKLKDRINQLEQDVQECRSKESSIQNVLILADKTAQETKLVAEEKAQQIKKEAQERANKITALAEERVARIIDQGRQDAYELGQKVEEAKHQYVAYKNQFRQLIEAQLNFIEQGDVRMSHSQEELTHAFAKIEEEASEARENGASRQVPSEDDELYYTTAYVPISDEEME